MIVYHRTAAAAAIIGDGFRDAPGALGLVGAWVSDRPLDSNEGTVAGGTVLAFVVGTDALAEFELVYDESDAPGYREWCAPAAVLNRHAVLVGIYPDTMAEELWGLLP